MNIFLANSFSNQVDENGSLLPELKTQLETILAILRNGGHEVFCAVEHEGWKHAGLHPDIGVANDLKEIDAADVLVVLLTQTISAGVQFEFGYSTAQGKKIILLQQSSEKLPYFNQGVVDTGRAELVSYDDTDSLIKELAVKLDDLQ